MVQREYKVVGYNFDEYMTFDSMTDHIVENYESEGWRIVNMNVQKTRALFLIERTKPDFSIPVDDSKLQGVEV